MMRFQESPKKLLTLLLLPLFCIACSGSKEQADGASEEEKVDRKTTARDSLQGQGQKMKAKVEDFSQLDGCRYMLIGPKEKKFHPLNLDTAYFEDGLKVNVEYREKDAITTCMAGTTIHILHIERRD